VTKERKIGAKLGTILDMNLKGQSVCALFHLYSNVKMPPTCNEKQSLCLVVYTSSSLANQHAGKTLTQGWRVGAAHLCRLCWNLVMGKWCNSKTQLICRSELDTMLSYWSNIQLPPWHFLAVSIVAQILSRENVFLHSSRKQSLAKVIITTFRVRKLKVVLIPTFDWFSLRVFPGVWPLLCLT